MPDSHDSSTQDPVRASVRFPLRLEVILHAGEREYKAMTEDVSANGLLFTAEDLPPVDSEVELKLTMPASIMGGTDDVTLLCHGRIVRHENMDGRVSAAAVIDDYSLKAEHL